jgi:hypothetical protein
VFSRPLGAGGLSDDSVHSWHGFGVLVSALRAATVERAPVGPVAHAALVVRRFVGAGGVQRGDLLRLGAEEASGFA